MIDTDKLTYEEYEAYKDLRNERDYVGEPSMWEIRDRAREIESRRREDEHNLKYGNFSTANEKWSLEERLKREDEEKKSYYRGLDIRSSKRNNDSETHAQINYHSTQQYPEPIAPNDEARELKETIRKKINDDTNFADVVAIIKQQDQKTINYLAGYMAKYPGTFYDENMDSANKIKFLGVGLELYDKSTGTAKNILKLELLKFRIGHYKGDDRKEMLNLFQKAKKMLKGEITEDVTVKGLTRKSYTNNSSLRKAVKESGNGNIEEELNDERYRLRYNTALLGAGAFGIGLGALVIGGGIAAGYHDYEAKKSHQQDPEDSKNKKEVVIPADKKNGGEYYTKASIDYKEKIAEYDEKRVELRISNKLQELKSKTHTDNIEDIPHAKTQVLRELAKDNLGKPKRSNADKQIIKSALDKATKNTRS